MAKSSSPVTVLAATDACADAARAALSAAGVAPERAVVELGEKPHERGPVIFVVEATADVPTDAVAGVDRDYVLLDRVADELALRVELLRKRSSRRRTRRDGAESLRASTMRLTWAVHSAETLDELARIATTGLREVFGAREVVLVIPAGPDEHDEPIPSVTWSARDGRMPHLGDLVAPLLPPGRKERGDRWATAPLTSDARIASMPPDRHPELLAWLYGESEQPGPVSVVPVDCDDAVTGALVVADPATTSRRTAFERSLLAYLGVQVGRAASELWLRDGELSARERLAETTSELQRLLDEMDELGVVIRSIADAVNVGVLFYDVDNQPKLHNRTVSDFLALTGFDPATGLSKHVYASDRRTRVKQDKNIISETIEGDQRGLIYWIGDPEGEQRAIVTEAHSISRPGGERLGSAVVTYDVTDLANAIEIREEYLATVSHELRTPLTSIVGYLDLIDDGYDVDALGFGKEFRTIQRSAEQMLALIRDLLSTSTHDLALRIEPTDVSALLAQSVSTFRPTLAASRQRLELNTPSGTVLAHVDGGRVRQVVDNLISNAVKYSPESGVITVTLERDEESVVIAVADRGRGISKTDQIRLFDRFFRTREAREAAIQGVGIGLTIVKTIVDAHGGTITVSSEPGKGSTFTVRLPLRPDATPLATLPMQP